jgi:hypothetical protein
MPMQCPFISHCPMFPHFRNELGLAMFKKAYCQSKRHEICERYKKASAGTMPPPDLLPNGRRLATADAAVVNAPATTPTT